jgi:hypothetical protein
LKRIKESLLSANCRILTFLFVIIFVLNGHAAERKILFREDFSSLENWRPFYFPKKKHTVYTIEQEGDKHCLRAESKASASVLVYKEKFSVYEYPRVRWRWKVNNIYTKGDDGTKAGDDYPMRIYIAFEYDSENEGFFEKIKNKLVRKIYGESPPHSSLNYVWASREHKERIINSPHTERVRIVILEEGTSNIGRWQDENIDIIEDYRKAYGSPPPAIANIAIMNDSDNTGESSVSFLDCLEVYR